VSLSFLNVCSFDQEDQSNRYVGIYVIAISIWEFTASILLYVFLETSSSGGLLTGEAMRKQERHI